jgi:hypothetical protein
VKLPGIPNPWALVAVAVALALSLGGGYWWGHAAATTACAAKAGKAVVKVEAIEDKRDAAIDAIGAHSRATTDVALNSNKEATDESAERIRRVPVSPACVVPGDVVRELDAARDAANAALRGGVRPGGPGSDPADR